MSSSSATETAPPPGLTPRQVIRGSILSEALNHLFVFKFDPAAFQLLENLGHLLQFGQGPQLLANVGPIKFPCLPHDDPLDIDPILPAAGESFQDHQVFGGTSSQGNLGRKIEMRGAANDQLFKRQPSQCYIESYALARPEQQHSPFQGKLGGVGESSFKVVQQNFYERPFPAESRQESKVDVNGLARLAPALERQSPYETELPALSLANRLKLGGSLDDFSHGQPPS